MVNLNWYVVIPLFIVAIIIIVIAIASSNGSNNNDKIVKCTSEPVAYDSPDYNEDGVKLITKYTVTKEKTHFEIPDTVLPSTVPRVSFVETL